MWLLGLGFFAHSFLIVSFIYLAFLDGHMKERSCLPYPSDRVINRNESSDLKAPISKQSYSPESMHGRQWFASLFFSLHGHGGIACDTFAVTEHGLTQPLVPLRPLQVFREEREVEIRHCSVLRRQLILLYRWENLFSVYYRAKPLQC